MSVLRGIADKLIGRPSKVDSEPVLVEPLAPPPPPAFLSANIKPDTTSLVLVRGPYNFAVCKGFDLPVVALLNDWVPGYATVFPFNQVEQIEVVISLVPPAPVPLATDAQPEMREAARLSADRDINIAFLSSIARDEWMRTRCILSTAGVFIKAQERYESRHLPMARAKYYHLKTADETPEQKIARERDTRRFIRLPAQQKAIAELCQPPAPAKPLIAPVVRPRIVATSLAEFMGLPADEQARMIAEQQSVWQHAYAPSWGNGARRKLNIDPPAPPMDEDKTTLDGAKLAPTADERIGTEDQSWK